MYEFVVEWRSLYKQHGKRVAFIRVKAKGILILHPRYQRFLSWRVRKESTTTFFCTCLHISRPESLQWQVTY